MISESADALTMPQLQATLDRLGSGSGPAAIRVYSTDRPATVGGHSDVPMSTINLANPPGVLDGAALTLTPTAAALVLVSGFPRWAEIVAADGVVLQHGDVTDDARDGFFKVSGADTPEGETSPLFFAGGLLSIGSIVLT